MVNRADLQIAPEQGQFMGLLVELMNAKRAIEIGSFTGYSAICIAQAAIPLMPIAQFQMRACDDFRVARGR